MKHKRFLALITALCMLFGMPIHGTLVSAENSADTPRVMEYLDRGLVAIPRSDGMYLTWRMFGDESFGITFDVYRNFTRVARGVDALNYLDSEGSEDDIYYVVERGKSITGEDVPSNTVISENGTSLIDVHWGRSSSSSSATHIASNTYGYFDVLFPTPAPVTDELAGEYTYHANDSTVGDVDADGQYEIIVKWDPSLSKDSASSGYSGKTLIGCYELDGTSVWQDSDGNDAYIDLGNNIRSGAHYVQIAAADFDSDGSCEIMLKTAPGSLGADGKYVTEVGTDSYVTGADNSADYRNGNGYVLEGEEFLTVFDGNTGSHLHTIKYDTK